RIFHVDSAVHAQACCELFRREYVFFLVCDERILRALGFTKILNWSERSRKIFPRRRGWCRQGWGVAPGATPSPRRQAATAAQARALPSRRRTRLTVSGCQRPPAGVSIL